MNSEASGSTRSVELLAWLAVNKKKVLIGAIAIAVLVSVLSIYRWSRAQAEVAASAALLGIERPAAPGGETKGPGAQAYLQVATAHPATSAGAQALLLGAEQLFKDGKYAEAKSQFEGFLRDHGENPFAATAAFGLAASLDSQDKTNEALAAYLDVAARYPNSAVAGQAKLALARLYEAKNEPAQAIRIYEELTRPNAPSVWASEAARHRDDLLSRHPELVKTNEPPPAATAPALTAPGTIPPLTATNLPPSNPPKP
ncbi:MAG TPA: tetratricopeptide repeat protein [Verrucomicrobiae bacterium]|nr:tetratricopeptide repeat protein [Verrucomicrobiae bacterium]